MKLQIERIFITDESRVFDADLSGGEVIVLVDQDGQVVYWNERMIRLPFHLSSPFIRLLDSETFLVVDVTHEGTPGNVWVTDGRGSILHSFHAGNAIGAVAVNDTGIWIGYADKGVFGEGISTEALVCFSRTGEVLQNLRTRKPTASVVG